MHVSSRLGLIKTAMAALVILIAAPSFATTCGGPYYVTSITTDMNNENILWDAFTPYAVVGIGTVDAQGNEQWWATTLAGMLPFWEGDIPDGVYYDAAFVARNSQAKAILETAMAAFETGAAVYPTVLQAGCSPTSTFKGRQWIEGMNGLWLTE